MKVKLSFQKQVEFVIDADSIVEARKVAANLAEHTDLEGWDTTDRWTWDAWEIPSDWKIARETAQALLRNGSLIGPGET